MIVSENICELSKSYHTMIGQLNNGHRPTRSLRSKFLANTSRIRNATSEYDAGLITIIEFLQRCSYSMAGYERRQRNWAMHVVPQVNIPVEQEQNLPNNDPIVENNLLLNDNDLNDEQPNIEPIIENHPINNRVDIPRPDNGNNVDNIDTCKVCLITNRQMANG